MTAAASLAVHDAVHWAAIRRPHRTTSLHLLVGLIHSGDSIAEAVLREHEVSDTNVWSAIDYWDPPRGGMFRSPRFVHLRRSPRWKASARAVAEHAAHETSNRGGVAVDTGDLLVALLSEPGSRASRILERARLDGETLRQAVQQARVSIDEGRGVEAIPDYSKRRPLRQQWDPTD